MQNIKFVLLALYVVLSGCMKTTDESFLLVCNGTQRYEFLGNGKLESSTSKTVTKSFIFKMKKLEDYECEVFSDEKIACHYSHKSDNSDAFEYETINIDRISGEVSQYYEYNSGSTKRTQSFRGHCERVQDKKF